MHLSTKYCCPALVVIPLQSFFYVPQILSETDSTVLRGVRTTRNITSPLMLRALFLHHRNRYAICPDRDLNPGLAYLCANHETSAALVLFSVCVRLPITGDDYESAHANGECMDCAAVRCYACRAIANYARRAQAES